MKKLFGTIVQLSSGGTTYVAGHSPAELEELLVAARKLPFVFLHDAGPKPEDDACVNRIAVDPKAVVALFADIRSVDPPGTESVSESKLTFTSGSGRLAA